MAQSMRSVSTVTDQGSFTGPSAHGSVDGAAPDTGDYWSGDDNAVDVLEVLLTDLSGTPPSAGTCTVDIYQAQCDGNVAPSSGGKTPTYNIEIYEGGTQRAVRSAVTAAEGSFTLDNILTFSASAITDWSDVRARFTSTGSGGSPSGRRGVAVSFIEVSTPDGGAPADNLLAEDVESASEVGTPSVGQEHSLTSVSVESASELSAPAVTQEHTLLADDVESAAELTLPVLAEASAGHTLLAEDIESAAELTAPSIGQAHAILANGVESASEIFTPTIGGVHILLADDTESISEMSVPSIGQPGGAGHANMAGRSRMAGMVGGHRQ